MLTDHLVNGQITPGPVLATVAAVGYAAHGLLGACSRSSAHQSRDTQRERREAWSSSLSAKTGQAATARRAWAIRSSLSGVASMIG